MAKRINTRFITIAGVSCAVVFGLAVLGPWLKGQFHGPVSVQVQKLVAETDLAQKEGRYPDARIAITKAWRLEPTSKELCLKRGDVIALMAEEDGQAAIDQARVAWENALAIDPTYKPALARLLNSYVDQLDVRPSPETCLRLRDAATRSSTADPSDGRAMACVYIATIQQWVSGMPTSRDQYGPALAQLAEINKKNPESADVLFYLLRGRLFEAKNDFNTGHADEGNKLMVECRGVLETTLAKHPEDANLNYRAFQCYVMLMDVGHDVEQVKKDHVAADAAIIRARTRVKVEDPRFDDLQYLAADWLRRNGHLDQAERVLRELYAVRPNDQHARVALAEVLSLTGDSTKREEAIRILSQKVTASGGSAARQLGKREWEIQTLLQLTSLRVAEYQTINDPAKRAALMDQIDSDFKKVKDGSIADAIPVLRLQGSIAQIKGHYVDAVDALEHAMVLQEQSDNSNPLKWDLMYQLAEAEHRAQQNKSAEKWFIQLVNRFDSYVPARLHLADLYLEENDFPNAQHHIEVLERQKPGSPEVTRLLILLYEKTSREKDASTLLAKLPEEQFDQKLSKAQVALTLKDYTNAIRLLNDMIKERPDDAGLAVALLQTYQATPGPQNITEMKSLLSEEKSRHPNDPRFRLIEAQIDHAPQVKIDDMMNEMVTASKDPFLAAVRDARKAMEAGNLDEALTKTRQADQIRNNDSTTWDLFFTIYLAQKNWDEANRAVENLARLNADQANGRMYRWKLAYARGLFNDAITTARELTVLRSGFGQSWILLAQAYQANGQYNEAIQDYQLAMERQNTNMDAYRGLADCYDELSEPDRALEIIKRGRRLFPDSVYLRERELGYVSQTDPLAVVKARQEILDANPNDAENYLAMASACVTEAQNILPVNLQQARAYTDQARDVLTKGVGKFPDHLQLNSALADALQASGHAEDGVKILADLANQPALKGKPEADLLLGEYYARAKMNDKAEKAFRDAWAISGNKNIEIELRIVALLEDQKKYDQCLDVLKANAENPRVSRQALQVHIAANHTEMARKGLNEALAQSPKDVNLLNLLAVVDIDGKLFPEARDVLAKALAIDPRNDLSLYYQALAELKDEGGGNIEIALRDLNAIITKNPRNVQFRLVSADAKLRIRDTEGASGDLEEALRLDPYNRDARLRLLDLYTQTKKWSKFDQVVRFAELNPVLSEAVWFRAHSFSLAAQGRYPEALDKIHETMSIDQKNPVYAHDYLNILLQSKNNQAVLDETQKLLDNGHREWWVYELRGMALSAQGNKTPALEQLDRAMAVADENKDTDAYQETLTAMGDISVDDAIARLAPRIESSTHWRLVSVSLNMKKSQWTAALAELDPLVKKSSQISRGELLTVLRLTAECYQSEAKPQIAKKYYLDWLTEAPNDTTALNNFAYLLAEDLHDPQAAKQYSQQAFDTGRRLNFTDPLIVDTHGWVLTLCGGNDANMGLSILSSLVDGHGDFLDARYHLARGYLMRNRPADALVQLNAAMELMKADEARGDTIRADLKAGIQAAMQEARQANASTR